MHNVLVALALFINLLPSWLNFNENNLVTNKIRNDYEIKKELTKDDSNQENGLGVTLSNTPIKTQNIPFNLLGSKAVVATDLESNKILYNKNENEKLQIASLTKLMTAYIILRENKLDEVVTVPTINNQSGDSLMGIHAGEKITVEALLNGLLINSGNDAAQALAIYNAGSIDKFVSKMNSYAEKLGLKNTNYSNPVGWDDPTNYSSANDVLSLTRVLLRNNAFKGIVKNKSKLVYTADGREITLSNTNKLLDGFNYFGVKTGYTLGAGECLVSLISQNGFETLTVVIGSNDRFSNTEALKQWIYSAYSW